MADAGRILDVITSPQDLHVLTEEELTILAREIREEIISTTSKTGGHVASSLGAVEIILAVHSLIDAPTDKFVFDVGHQAYAHKLVTGRLDKFDTLRRFGGISGFPKPSESPYDVHPSGHASDSLSVALGLAMARDLRGGKEKIVSLIGDASIAGGMAFEALSHIGAAQTPMLIILNDNEMSISYSVGALAKHFGTLRTNEYYRSTRDDIQDRMERSGDLGRWVSRTWRSAKDSVKQLFVPDTMIFEQLGIVCTVPIDGHDIHSLREMLKICLPTNGPVLMHVVTKKGVGYEPAMKDPERFHGVGPYDIATGKSAPKAAGTPPTYTEVFGQALVEEARADEDVVALTAAMRSGTGLSAMEAAFPDRFIDGGIAEEHVVGMACGLAYGGKKPVCASFSTFLLRAFDQAGIDAALPHANVVFAIDRAGVVGDDGPTHHGVFDLAYMRMIPGMRILAPSDEAELVLALHTALAMEGPVAVRYPRGEAEGVPVPAFEDREVLECGRARLVYGVEDEVCDVDILAWGHMVASAKAAVPKLADAGVSARVWDMRWAKPIDRDVVVSSPAKLVVTVEEGALAGGLGQAVASIMAEEGLEAKLLTLGISDEFVPQGKPAELLHLLGLDAEGIAQSIREKLQ